MDTAWTFSLSIILLSVTQIQHVWAGCTITSVTSPSASTLNVKWEGFAGATAYHLALRVVNSTTIAPVVVQQTPPYTQRLVQGLRPGHLYQITLKVFEYLSVKCTAVKSTMTVPATSQITLSKAISSTAIMFEWSGVVGADGYILVVELYSNAAQIFNQTFTGLDTQVDGLTPSTTYNCYVVSANSAGMGTKSVTRTIKTLVQPPTGVALVPTGKSTARVTWDAVSNVLVYQVKVIDSNPSKPPVIKHTYLPVMEISDLEPCSQYTVAVSSVNDFREPGEPSNVTHSTATINPVTTVNLDYSCSSDMVTVTWNLVFGATSYRAIAVDGTGASRNCTAAATSTSCQITMLKCGENYRVTVMTLSDDCESTSNITSSFETVPCAPAQLQTIHECSSNIITFSWQPTNNTFYYVAKAVDRRGHVTECRTKGNKCHFTNVGCGQFYKYYVYAVSTCNSEVSSPEFIQTSPCLPTNVKTLAECTSEELITTWDSAAGALSYFVEAEGNTGHTYNCSSASNSCVVGGVPCGQHLSVWIIASNDNCSTSRVLGQVAETVPCTPTNVSAAVDCSQDSARVNWTSSIGAVFYIAQAEHEDGTVRSCKSMHTNCLIEGLRCGQSYNASVMATNLKCNSTVGQRVPIRMAPCAPTNIRAIKDCEANHVVISWQNHQTTGTYTAVIKDHGGDRLNCTSTSVNNCTIPNLPCGRRYNVTVTYDDGNCHSTSTQTSVDSVQCGPVDVRASVACDTGELTVAWNISVPAENYTTYISRGTDDLLKCYSKESPCTLGGLACGSSYNVTVFAVNGFCLSQPSTYGTIQTLPCPPTYVSVMHTCELTSVPVTWVASTSAKSYSAVAVSAGGHRSECSTNETSCSFPVLQCGEVYMIGVASVDNFCTGQQSQTVSLHTAPCAPSNLSSVVNCTAATALLAWSHSPNAVNYSVKAVGADGDNVHCNSSGLSCTLTDLVCGQEYDVSVAASAGTCVSPFSAPFRQSPAPCPPVNVTTNLYCDTNLLMVSWSPAATPLNYSVTAVPLAGGVSQVTCHSNNVSCSLRGLQCGHSYNILVRASHGGCSGPYSTPQTVQTAPCSPQSLVAQIECGTNSLLASWNSSLGADSYTATVTGPHGFSDSCTSSNLSCSVTGLRCASQYNITVTSKNSECTAPSSQISALTGPCDPMNVTGVLLCGTDRANVSWTAAAGAVAYTVVAREDGSQHSTSCRSSTTSCELNRLHCGKVYNLTVWAEDASCNSTGSANAVLVTAPCSPSIRNNSLICGTNSSSLSWTQVVDATRYTANANASGHVVSCSSATDTCNLEDLMCSEIYTVTVIAQGSHCDSVPSPSIDFATAPCPPTIISKRYNCDNDTRYFKWTDSRGSHAFLAQLAGGGYLQSCLTTNTNCVFANVPCGLDISLTVQAQGAPCNSTPSASEAIEIVPCAPENVSASLVCFNHSVLVTWAGSSSAVAYTVIATGQDGHTHHCNTNTTSCQIPNIHCGETYNITVTPYSKSCPGHPSAVYIFKAGLCAPSNVTVSPACGPSIVSWLPVAGADMYIATATADDGHTHNCSSSSSNSCNFTDLHCGETYTVTVVTVDRGCWSAPSSGVQLRTALCPPTNLTGQVNCSTNVLTLTWDPVVGASYILPTQKIIIIIIIIIEGNNTSTSIYPNSSTSHTITGLLCGQRYTVSIAASYGTCQGHYSRAIEIGTVPCQPTNFTARVDCGTNMANFSWAAGAGAEFYTVEVTGAHGHIASCSTNDTSCAVKLHCGRSYSATLVASIASCNSSEHADINFYSAPCLPENVVAELQCNTSVLAVSWQETPGSDTYTAWAIRTDNSSRSSCNSTSNSCDIHDLQCGQTYEVVVTSSSVHCDVVAGSDYWVQSAPCKPKNTAVDLNCSTNAITVKWDQTSTAQNYTVTATSAVGVNSTCYSDDTSCSFLDLSCGQFYTFTVTGHTNVCISEMSNPIDKHTAPCPPTSVSAELNCSTGDALVSWSSAAAAMAYSAHAESNYGHNASCSDTGTSCSLNNLLCGQDYTIVVVAMNTGCPGPASTHVKLTTEPCVPTNLSVHYNTSTAHVMWDAARDASSYWVRAVTDQGLTVTCNSTNTSCYLTGLRCSHMYNITVTAHNLACNNTVTSETYHLVTEPCPPANIHASMVCEQFRANVSWQLSKYAVGYVAYADNQNGHYTLCDGTSIDSSCVVSALVCGTVYNVRVKALGQQYNSSYSTEFSLASGPCPPSGINAIMDCQARSAIISWLPGAGATSYVTELTASSGHTASCTTNHTNCELTSLQCGQKYNVTVIAQGETCNTTAQMTGYFTTEPCVPMNLSVHYNTSTAHVMWDAARGASNYSVQAVTDQGLTVTCNSTNTSCYLTSLGCSHIYNITVTAHNLACYNTVTSEPYSLVTEPCRPKNVQVSVACVQQTATVTWELSNNAVGYVAYFVNEDGQRTSCAGRVTDTQCVVSGLMCGTVYNVWMKALGQQYNSSNTTEISLLSAPCAPSTIQVTPDCTSDGAAVVSWNNTKGKAVFSLMAMVGGNLQTLCTTQQNSCKVTGLSCGETYILSLSISNSQCNITAPARANLTTRPCAPQRVGVDLQCSNHTTVLTWEKRSDVELYMANAITEAGRDMQQCNSTESTCQFPGLTCGETYNFTVTAYSNGCSSQASRTVSITTEPCQPVIVGTQAPCQSDVVQITWNQTRGVMNYIVTATGNLGYVDIQNTTGNVLSVPLPCGQNYNVTVKGRGEWCDSIPSSPAFFKTTPCIPRDVRTYIQCEFNMGSVGWAPSDGAKSYSAIATGHDGHTHKCVTNTTVCTWHDLHCGEDYTVVVRAMGHNCTSLPSNSSIIHMDPCVPQNLVGSVDCDMKVVSLSWNGTNRTTLYEVNALSGSNKIGQTTNDTRAYFSDLNCGQVYSLTVTPHHRSCPGNSSAPVYVNTWPCMPTGVSTLQNCLSGIVTVTWQASNGTDNYIATMQTDSGLTSNCTSSTNQCRVHHLTCGHKFSVSVTASNQQCNTTSNVTTSLQSVPCVPTNVSVEMYCANNTAVVSWSASRGAVQYFVSAYGSQGNVTCQTSGLSCNLASLTCGSHYTVHVVAMDDNCSSIPSQAVMFSSAPCTPQNVSTQFNCSANVMMISWDSIRHAEYFLVSVVAANGGGNDSCNTTNTECSIRNLTCGKTFSVQVTAVGGSCNSQHSQTITVLSAPCQPQGIRGDLDCVTNSAWISWDAAPGAESYTVMGLDGDGYKFNCTTSTNTTCEVQDLACGVLYNFSIIATNTHCESLPSATMELQTAPCSLSSITAFPLCHNSSINVTWNLMTEGNGNTLYTARAEASDRSMLSCNSTGTSCYLYGARCGFHYTITVGVTSDQCSGLKSPPYRISMEPCPPRDVMVKNSCGDHALVSWSPSPLAETYHVVATDADGHVHTCNTSYNNCSFSDLLCGRQYTVAVTASHENCSSNASENITLKTDPCHPEGLSVMFHCQNESAVLTWMTTANAVDYFGCALTDKGEVLRCNSKELSCVIEGLNCGTMYNFSVQASDGTCNSSFSDPVLVTAVPCPPSSVQVQLFPMQDQIQVMYFSWTQINCTDTQYKLKLTGSLLGDNQALFDISSYCTRRTYFEIPLPCSSSFNATVTSKSSAGTSEPSAALSGTTAPCPPSAVTYSGNRSLAMVSWNAAVFATTYTVYDDAVLPRAQICSTSGLNCSLTNIPSANLVITASNAAGESEAVTITGVPSARRRRDLNEETPQNEGYLPVPSILTTPESSVVMVKWSKVEGATDYSVVIAEQGGLNSFDEYNVQDGESIYLTDLSPDTLYCITVTAMTSDDTSGPVFTPACVRTSERQAGP